MTKIEEKMKSVVGDEYWDWFCEILDDINAENPGIDIVSANIKALETLNAYHQSEIDGLQSMSKQMKRDNKIDDLLNKKK